jgi:large subunit ribosomal protein LP1
MPLTLKPSDVEKSNLVTSLAAIIINDCSEEAEVTAEGLEAVIKAAGCEVPAYYPKLFSQYITAAGGVEKFFAAPGAGGGGAAAPAAGGAAEAAAPAAAEKPKEEEVDALEGGELFFGVASTLFLSRILLRGMNGNNALRCRLVAYAV